MLHLSNGADDYQSKLSVKLKVMYICDFDSFKQYEINLKPGEYSYQEIMHKIKERV